MSYNHYRKVAYDKIYRFTEWLFLKVPQIKGKILWYECGTPVSDANFLQSYRGGSYGTRCNLQFSNRENSRWLMRADTEIGGLYTAGQDAWTPAVAGAMYGGLLCAMKVKHNLNFHSSIKLLSVTVSPRKCKLRIASDIL